MIVRQKVRYLAGRHPILTTYDTRSNVVLKLLSPFVFKKIEDFCLLNLIRHIKYNLSLSFIPLTTIFLTAREYFAFSSTRCFLIELNLISFLLTFIPEQLLYMC